VASRRLSPLAILLATAFALVAAVGTFALLDSGNDDASGDGGADPTDGYDLTPADDLPGSVGEVRVGALGDTTGTQLGDLLTGEPMVVNFFAPWCAPCVDEMPAFERVHQDVGDEVTFVGLAVPPNLEGAVDTVDATGVTYPTYADSLDDALLFFGGINMPTTVFVGADGEVLHVNSGQLTEDELRGQLADLFGTDT
jgi:thiol-disulfide isomerase/thioredoxin